jgi:pimeloyl-ACP methyl ester carboxylesterase
MTHFPVDTMTHERCPRTGRVVQWTLWGWSCRRRELLAPTGVIGDSGRVADIVLVPGLWLDASCWDQVVPGLARLGHRSHPLTLPGMHAADDRASITLADLVAEVVAQVDRIDPVRPVVLVGHSAAGALVHAAVDARPERVAHVVYIGGWPTPHAETVADFFEPDAGEVRLPDWSAFDDADLGGLDEQALADFRARAIPAPAGWTRGVQQLSDERRYDVPVTVVATEFSSEALQGWMAEGMAPVRELSAIRDVTYVDLPTGHWPQLSRPDDLAAVIADAAGRAGLFPSWPPLQGDEVACLVGALERQRETLAWKVGGLDSAGLARRLPPSTVTPGGLLKHLAFVERYYFSYRLFERPLGAPFVGVDWDAEPDWDWRTAAEDTPGQLYGYWRDAVAGSRQLLREWLAAGGLDRPTAIGFAEGTPTLRPILVGLVEEYARHTGHADLIRESIDGVVGEDPPD